MVLCKSIVSHKHGGSAKDGKGMVSFLQSDDTLSNCPELRYCTVKNQPELSDAALSETV
jgi:hypothetical protein